MTIKATDDIEHTAPPAAPERRKGLGGRPKIDKEERRRERQLMMSDKEWLALKALAALSSSSVSAMIRRQLVEPPRRIAEGDGRALLAELGRVGNNINQIAHALNFAAKSGEDRAPRLDEIDVKIEQLMDVISELKAAIIDS